MMLKVHSCHLLWNHISLLWNSTAPRALWQTCCYKASVLEVKHFTLLGLSWSELSVWPQCQRPSSHCDVNLCDSVNICLYEPGWKWDYQDVCDVSEFQTAEPQDSAVLHQTQAAFNLTVCACLFACKETRNPFCNSHIAFLRKLVKVCFIYLHINQFLLLNYNALKAKQEHFLYTRVMIK